MGRTKQVVNHKYLSMYSKFDFFSLTQCIRYVNLKSIVIQVHCFRSFRLLFYIQVVIGVFLQVKKHQ